MLPTTEPLVRLDGTGQGQFLHSYTFSDYQDTLIAMQASEVLPLLAEVEAATDRGWHAVGYLAYEAATAINPVLPTLPPCPGLPLAWFALYRQRHVASQISATPAATAPQLTPRSGLDEYAAAIAAIRQYIANGECYQLNYTFPCTGQITAMAEPLYLQLLAAQRPAFGALIDTGRFALLSASPELFFARRGNEIVTRPMKGTAPRGRFPDEDQERITRLRNSSKEQAENLMIVDLLRSDLGQVAITGSVQVHDLFQLETYPSLHQLTSTVKATLRDNVGLTELLTALFPCGSITGAPKRRAMELLAQLEGRPRGVYCGAIGHFGPGREATFSVAIRTLMLDRATGTATLGVGSGITWDSDPAAEYAECLTKGTFLSTPPPPDLIESLRLENGRYCRLERHLDRLEWSAGRLGHRFNRPTVTADLLDHAAQETGLRKVRLQLTVDGAVQISSEPLPTTDDQPLRLALSSEAIDPDQSWPYLKTVRRDHFARARTARPDADELLFRNQRGELTEGTYHSLVLRLDGHLLTPPLTSGLLPGILRAELLANGDINEQILTLADLQQAEEIWLINSVRGWRRAVLIAESLAGEGE